MEDYRLTKRKKGKIVYAQRKLSFACHIQCFFLSKSLFFGILVQKTRILTNSRILNYLSIMNEPRNNSKILPSPLSLLLRRQSSVVFPFWEDNSQKLFPWCPIYLFLHRIHLLFLFSSLLFSSQHKMPLFGTVYLWIPSILRVTMHKTMQYTRIGEKYLFSKKNARSNAVFCWLYFLLLLAQVSPCTAPRNRLTARKRKEKESFLFQQRSKKCRRMFCNLKKLIKVNKV